MFLIFIFHTDNSFNSLVGQITNLILPVVVVWVGPNLRTIVTQRENTNQYSLFHNWQPDDISASGHYSRVAFPSCIGDGSDDQTYHGCDYPFHSINKVIWRGVMNSAPDIQRFVMKMNMSERNIESILKDYHTTTLSMADYACSWAKANKVLWLQWIPGRSNDIKPQNHGNIHNHGNIRSIRNTQTIFSQKPGNHFHHFNPTVCLHALSCICLNTVLPPINVLFKLYSEK